MALQIISQDISAAGTLFTPTAGTDLFFAEGVEAISTNSNVVSTSDADVGVFVSAGARIHAAFGALRVGNSAVADKWIEIEQGALVAGGNFGISLNGNRFELKNAGQITGGTNGMIYELSNASHRGQIINSGKIIGGSNALIYNNGSETGTLTINNSGLIWGGNKALAGSAGLTYRVTNTGEFRGVVELGNQSDRIDNIGGKIVGNLFLLGGNDLYNGATGQILGTVFGDAGIDTIKGGANNDVFNGGADGDKLFGGKGNDTLNGDAGDDYLQGDDGNDTLSGGDDSDTLVGGLGNDTLNGGAGNDVLRGDDGDDTLNGGANNDELFGGKGTDKLNGDAGNDTLQGDAGDDVINGGVGVDKLYGGVGKDTLTGGADKDTFIFKSIADSTVAASGRDVIKDFSRAAAEKIDLKLIDANTKVAGDQAFKFIDKQAFHKTAGELRYEIKSGDTFIHGDVNGDGKADFSIVLDLSLAMKATDFIL